MKVGTGIYETNRTEDVRVGKQYVFCYPDEFTSLPEYTAHAGQVVTVLCQLSEEECDPECQPMWRIQASDGWIGAASDGELDAVTDQGEGSETGV